MPLKKDERASSVGPRHMQSVQMQLEDMSIGTLGNQDLSRQDQSLLQTSTDYYMSQKFHKSIDALDLRKKRRREKSQKSKKSRSRSNKTSQKRLS